MNLLFFYPENLLKNNQGNHSRALAQLEYFKHRGISVFFVGIYSLDFTNLDIQKMIDLKLIKNGSLLKRDKKGFGLEYFIKYSLPKKLNFIIQDFDRTRFGQDKKLKKIMMENDFDFIFFSYAYWQKLIDVIVANKKTSNLIIDTHDFLTSQFQNNKKFEMGKYFKTEISILNKFDKVIVISFDEKYLFSQFLNKDIHYIPHTISNNINMEVFDYKTDIIYVASDNEHNIKSAKWFFDDVYPLLSLNYKITVVGKIVNHIKDYVNVEKIAYIEDLSQIYSVSKIAICPMLTGTGLKIKVIEALSFGIPIVTTERGLDGLVNKSSNGCLLSSNPKEFADNINLLFDNKQFYDATRKLAIQNFNENFDKKIVYNFYDKLFEIK